MDTIDWGIGIEHEVILLYKDNHHKLGKEIIKNLSNENDDMYKNVSKDIVRVIDPKCEYSIFQYYNVDNRINDMIDFFKDNSISPKLGRFINEYLVLTDTKIPEKDFDKINIIIDRLTYDGTNFTNVIEFITLNYANKSINYHIEEMDRLQEIVRLLVSQFLNRNVYYPEVGWLFPLKLEDSYYLDYSGSYHLNLSLPYSNKKLCGEKVSYFYKKDEIKKYYKNFLAQKLLGHLKYQYDLLLGSMMKDLYKGLIIKYPNVTKFNSIDNIRLETDKLSDEYLKYDKFLSQTDYPINNFTILITKMFKRLKYKIRYQDGNIVRICFWNPKPNSLLENLYTRIEKETNIAMKKKRYTIIISLNKSNIIVRERKHIGGLSDSRINISDFPIILTLETPKKIIQNFREITNSMTEEIQKDLIENIKIKFNYIFENINSRQNTYNLYRISEFHRLHAKWAVNIQWLLPLILSCFSSCDPFSIGDDNKLSELSLRSFISNYSFFNLLNIKDINIRSGYTVPSYQKTQSNLVDMIVDQFDYNRTKETFDLGGFSGGIHKHGFGFGFELRVFDNFNIKYVENLLELLFLLADHTVDTSFEIIDNPFNNDILNRNTLNILKQGWNTIIDKDYLSKLEENLKISFQKFSEPPLAYNVINYIYQYLQNLYIDNGKGIGNYSQYVIKRGRGIRSLRNINRLSWDKAFKLLIWNPTPKTDLRIILEEIYHLSYSRKDFYQNLLGILGKDYRDDVRDIMSSLIPLIEYKVD